MAQARFTLSRRGFLKAGAVSVLASLGRPAFGAPTAPSVPGKRARALIVLWMAGGPSHVDTFDPKPGTPEGGPFAAIDTTLTGLRISEHLPRVAKHGSKLAVVRSVTSVEGDHQRALTFVRTGHRPMAATVFPGIGAVLSRERAGSGGPPLRAFSLLQAGEGAGFLGAEHAPLLAVDPDNPLEGWFPDGYEPDVLKRRAAALDALEEASAAGQASAGKLEAEHRRVAQLARELVTSDLVAAMDIKKEPPKSAAAYGATPFGKGCLLARRLVAAGVPYVEVTLDGWDSHIENFRAHEMLMGNLDPAYATLLSDLTALGLLDSTLVYWGGEFGRTPAINGQHGRDHHPHAFSVVLAGGGIKAGQVIGATDARGGEVTERPVPVPDLLATVYAALGVPADKSYVTTDGRPVTLLDKATQMKELI